MDDFRNLSSEQNAALVIFTFLQADCINTEYCKELISLGKEYDPNCNGPRIDTLDDGDLETDGHLPTSLTIALDGVLPSVQLHRNPEEEAALQRVAEELREIAAQLEENVVAQATQNLRRNILITPCNHWRYYLNREVERVMSWVVGLEHLPYERVIVALTLTLVKGVCEQTPQLLKNLFYTALQYITSSSRAR
ncbi:BH3 interacting domain death agonist [Anabas testudineus]|uniref:BH3-interacting domain death agonist n=1 Tax=Anabas testudineus TaxID=64144 RepID=A0A7N6FDS8_ANATE|nr:BH3 interacting domain death agonist [Anabas testudineus]XP_033181899.1 BH3 interacting domain death agonist [Anabas testudineus]